MDLGIRGRTALVCGASSGLGLATAEGLAGEGVNLILVARRAELLETIAARLSGGAVTAAAIAADLSRPEGLSKVETALAGFQPVDILITNTGGPPASTPLDTNWNLWQTATELLLRSTVELSRLVVPGMRRRQWGRVIGITSYAVKHPLQGLVLSNSLRAAVTAYYRTLADEVAGDGVTVNTVLPGYTATERLNGLAQASASRDGITMEQAFARMRAASPAGRLGTPEEIASAIAYLASEPAAFITGQAVCVDGGAAGGLL